MTFTTLTSVLNVSLAQPPSHPGTQETALTLSDGSVTPCPSRWPTTCRKPEGDGSAGGGNMAPMLTSVTSDHWKSGVVSVVTSIEEPLALPIWCARGRVELTDLGFRASWGRVELTDLGFRASWRRVELTDLGFRASWVSRV